MSQTILVVDDEEEIRRLLERTLSKYGFDAISAEDAVQGLLKAQDNAVDLIITDIRMPGIDGLDFIGQIHDIKPGLPVIVITGYGGYETAMEAIHRGAFFFISKPFDNDTIVETVRKGLRLPHAVRSEASANLGSRLLFSVNDKPSAALSEGVIASLLPLMQVYGFDSHTTNVRLPFIVDELICRAIRVDVSDLKVEAILEQGKIDLTFSSSNGAPFEPESIPSSASESDLSTSAGVGMLVVTQYCDQLTFVPGGEVARAALFRKRPVNA